MQRCPLITPIQYNTGSPSQCNKSEKESSNKRHTKAYEREYGLFGSDNLPMRTCLHKGSPSSLSRSEEEETQEVPGAEPQSVFHGCEMPRML